MTGRNRRWWVALLPLALVVTACGEAAAPDDGDGAFEAPDSVDFVVHTGPGGGSDVFARAIAELLVSEGLTDEQWPVLNEEGGSGAAAMAFMAEQDGRDDVIAAHTVTWLATPLTNEEAAVDILQLTPIAQLVSEPTVMAVPADSEFDSLQDFVDAAEADPGGLIQAGGSVTSTDALAAEVIKADTGTEWGYLSFEGGGERIAALLGGNADMMFGGPSDFTEQVAAGELKVIATIGPEPTALFPDAPTLAESGFDLTVPEQIRGIVGPPGMSEGAIAFYEDLFEQLLETEGWAEYAEENGFTTAFRPRSEYVEFLTEQIGILTTELEKLGLLAE